MLQALTYSLASSWLLHTKIKQYFLNLAKEFQEKNSNTVKIQYIVGEDLAKQGLNLLYNVGKGSSNPPILVNLSYRGNLSRFDFDFEKETKETLNPISSML